MTVTVKPELSEKSKYWIDRHRYYELKHFCLQYPSWKKSYEVSDGMNRMSPDLSVFTKTNIPSDPTAKCVELRSLYFERMELINKTAIEADSDLASYIIKAVTEGLSYTHLKTRLEIPCGRDMYYDRYRRFFWLLNKTRK